jgi:delta1-piperideine-2-carboxylate reductase
VTTISPSDLHRRVEAIFLWAGLHPVQAAAVTRTIVAGERDGCTSHGLHRIGGTLRTVKAGKVERTAVPVLVEQSIASVVRVDARGGFANPALELGLPALIDRARTHGMAALVVNDAAHFSALWPEVETLADAGLASLAMCPSYSVVAPAGGNAPLFGTNPIAFGWPRPGRDPFVFDMATSVAARGEIELHRRAGTPLPDGWAVDADGQPTTDPAAALSGAMLTFGGHKGSAISTMIELLGGVLIGDATSAEALATLGTTTLMPTHGELVIALSPDAFASGGPRSAVDFASRADVLFDSIIGQGARLPSQQRYIARAASLAGGIPLTEAQLANLDDLTARGLDAIDIDQV